MAIFHLEPPHGYTFGLNKLRRDLFMNCQPSLMVWIEAGFPALFQAWYSFSIFDLKHVIHTIFGQSWVQGLRLVLRRQHGRSARKGRHGKIVFTDSSWTNASYVYQAEKVMFRILVVADIITWYMWFGNILGNFVVNWVNTAYKYAGCDTDPMRHWFSSELPIGGWSGDNDWQVGPGWLNCSGTEGSHAGSVFSIPTGWYFNGGFAVQVYFILSTADVQFSTRLVDADSGEVFDAPIAQYNPALANGQGMSFMTRWRNNTGSVRRVAFEVQAHNGADHGSYFTPGVGSAHASWGPNKPKGAWH